jgi:hypothetical protein
MYGKYWYLKPWNWSYRRRVLLPYEVVTKVLTTTMILTLRKMVVEADAMRDELSGEWTNE